MKRQLTLMFFLTSTFCFAQTDSLKYQFINWYLANLKSKTIYVDRVSNNISKVDLGTEVSTYKGCGREISYNQKIIDAVKELNINYDTFLLHKQIEEQSYNNFLYQDKLQKGKIISWKLSPFNSTLVGSMLIPFKHRATLSLSTPLWTDNNRVVVLKTSLLSRQSKKIRNGTLEIYQCRDGKTFELLKVIDEI